MGVRVVRVRIMVTVMVRDGRKVVRVMVGVMVVVWVTMRVC